MSDELSERLAKLEERYAWLQRHVVEQDKVMLALSETVERLRQELTRLRDRGDSTGPSTLAEERPPHY